MASLLLLVTPLHAAPDLVRQVADCHLIGDCEGALRLATRAVDEMGTPDAQAAYIKALAVSGRLPGALAAWDRWGERLAPERSEDVMEAVAWSVIQSAAHGTALQTRLIAMIAAAMTHNVEAVPLIQSGMHADQALLRLVAVGLAAELGDAVLKNEIEALFRTERDHKVRLAVISAMGKLRMTPYRAHLEGLIGCEQTTAAERAAAIEAVANMLDSAGREEVTTLSRSTRAGLRELAAKAIAVLELKDQADLLVPLLSDHRPDVRTAALVALGLLRVDFQAMARPLLQDPNSTVAITAAWYAVLNGDAEGLATLHNKLASSNPHTARLAAAAVRHLGLYGVDLSRSELKVAKDPFVRANLSLGLIETRCDATEAAEALHRVFTHERGRWMWDHESHPLFASLSPSDIKHNPTIPNHPEVVNQMTRLEVLGTLALVRYPEALEGLRTFLKERSWGVSGVAAVTLIEEGDDMALELVRTLTTDPDHQVRVQAALGLAIWGRDSSALAVLEEAYSGADRELKLKILEALGRVGDRSSIPFLVQALHDPFPIMRVVAASSLLLCLEG